MKRFLIFIVALSALVSGGVYFTAETIILPKQEAVWRTLLEDLPWGLQADFEDVDFELIGLRLSVGGTTISNGDGNTIKVSEIVAENSLETALGNLVRFVLGREEERYDVVRFIGVEPVELEDGLDLRIQEIRLLDVAIGIDNELPTTMKTLTGAINLEKAFAAGKIGGYEVHGVSASLEGMVGSLKWMKVHGITKTNLELVEVNGLSVVAGAQTLAQLDMFKTTNFNIATLMEPAQAAELAGAAEKGDLSAFNIFHLADDLVLVGFDVQAPGFGGLAIKRLMYKEEEVEIVANAGIVPTRTFSELRDFSVQFPALAMISPEVGQFMEVTGITGFDLNAQSDGTWDLVTGVQNMSGWSDFVELIKFTLLAEFGNLYPEDIVKATSEILDMTDADGADPNAIMQQVQDIYGAITLNNFDYLIENKSLIERLYRYAEVAFGMPEADLKALLDAQLAAVQNDPTLPASLVEDFAALRAFVATPRSLRIVLAPPVPVSFNDLAEQQDPDMAVEMIGITITANGAP